VIADVRSFQESPKLVALTCLLINIARFQMEASIAKEQTAAQFYADERHIEQWRIKRLVKTLEETRGNGTSFVSLYIPAKENINKINEMLVRELSGCQSIKSKQTRTSVETAISTTQGSKSLCIVTKKLCDRTQTLQRYSTKRSRNFLWCY